MSDPQGPDLPAPLRHHPRQWRDHVYVYPVISRRSRGVSVGVNLSRDKRCTFSCAYCQVNRAGACANAPLDLPLLRKELALTLREAAAGALWSEPRFAETPPAMRELRDIAFSGDGEPTLLEDFDGAVAAAGEVRRELGRTTLPLVIITNASALDRPPFRRALPLLAPQDEIWAKLDAGTEELFQRINHPFPVVSLRHVLSNILAVAKLRPIVIQSLLLRLDGAAPGEAQVQAYCDRLRELVQGGGWIRLVQIYTVARAPADKACAPLTPAELQAVADRVREAIPGTAVETY